MPPFLTLHPLNPILPRNNFPLSAKGKGTDANAVNNSCLSLTFNSMSDDITPLQSRITAIVSDEELLNRNRKSALETRQARRDGEKRTEAANLATIEKAKKDQMDINENKERKFMEDLKKQGTELVNVSKEIRDDYIAEMQHRKIAKEKLQTKIAALETKMRSIKAARPS